ncbi:hypothetical protein EDD37DRAFT_607851 [Exophiala viscosa]|uniref:Uncharacterized protein n=1 Tax=Exophiala viscosa TaxID=2486360 RepID=A0AAN6DXA2_9EURO|nr:hypothetical protein EDD36DRAFT_465338 [Exophiala viscosa]KAI1626279.1 hypothetical protein EDD37DRAFT_607851 [Exophiala viscosa]
MDPESSDSDVSAAGLDSSSFASPITTPIPLPPPPSKHALESPEAIEARLNELARVEAHNIKKYDLLKAKRVRKDEKIRRRREAQDKKWAAILQARERRDARIESRRRRENAVFSQFFDRDFDEEDDNLRRRLKRLKRGLPAEESPKPASQTIPSTRPSTAMSPTGPSLSTIPPPAKRHQVGPPGQSQTESRPSTQSSLSGQNSSSQPPKSSLPAPPYSFYRDPGAFSRPYQHGPSPSAHGPSPSPTAATNGLSQSGPERPPLGINTVSPRPYSSTPSATTPPTTNPARQTSSSYDTRPPPTTSSGFASVNPPSGSGFATINPRSTATPPSSHVAISRPTELDPNETPASQIASQGLDSRFQQYGNAPNSASPAGSSTSKRTPSTTHPYQMSEAFANRHHHCERVDSLNRGIWTSYGLGGTQENPTAQAVEMYLRCNHDDCRRIDWRTVHGLQCHIVKNHVQPKGTIGSLDKALERYGVPVKEVEDYEREHGRGSGGTMADPKNHKIKVKTKEALETKPFVKTNTPGAYDPEARPAGYRPSPTESPTISEPVPKSLSASTNGAPADEKKVPPPQPPPQPQRSPINPNPFSAIRSNWLGPGFRTEPPRTEPVRKEPEPKKLQGDFGEAEKPMSNGVAAAPRTSQPNTVHQRDSSTISVADTSKAVENVTIPPAPPAPRAEEPKPQEKEAPVAPKEVAKDEDVQMTDVADEKKDAVTEEKPESKQPEAESPEDHSETIVVDGDANKDVNASKRIFQSPVMTAATVPATTPSSARRPSRRSSVARKSVDSDAQDGKVENEDKDEKEKDEKTEKETPKSEPRRSIGGRVLRKTRA